MYYFIIFLTITLVSLGIIMLKRPFFSFAHATSVLLNCMLETNMDESAKRKKHLQSLSILLSKFGLLLLFVILILIVSLVPILLFLIIRGETIESLDTSSFYFYSSMLLGSVILFIIPAKNKKNDYSGLSKLLHKMILDNYNISRSLFKVEKRFLKREIKSQNNNFVIVTGLARGGTTALTNLLYDTNKFYSLSYNNMPFLLAVNLWRKLYRPRKNKLKQRAHGDNLMFGFETIEALEEHFFKVFLRDKYISETDLKVHNIDENTYKEYLVYQSLLRNENKNSIYLAKNNNFILRQKSLRKYNSEFKIVLIFRRPLAHAFSLLNQHEKFSEKQKEDTFVLEYMNWLGHHEFGLNHKAFNFESSNTIQKYKSNSINYWLTIWIDYYSYVISLPEDKNLFLVEYADLCNTPNKLLKVLEGKLGLELSDNQKKPYPGRELPELKPNPEIIQIANNLYKELVKHKVVNDVS